MLDLKEPVSVTMTREEFAICVMAIAFSEGQLPKHLTAKAETISLKLQNGIAPAGVIARVARGG